MAVNEDKLVSDWVATRASALLKSARLEAGKGWNLLGTVLKEALIAREVVSMMLAQDEETLEKNPALKRMVEVARKAYEKGEGS